MPLFNTARIDHPSSLPRVRPLRFLMPHGDTAKLSWWFLEKMILPRKEMAVAEFP